MVLFSLPFFMNYYSNGRLLQLIECIESIKSDVKKKMMLRRACDRYTKVTRDGHGRNFLEPGSILEVISSQNSFGIRDSSLRWHRKIHHLLFLTWVQRIREFRSFPAARIYN